MGEKRATLKLSDSENWSWLVTWYESPDVHVIHSRWYDEFHVAEASFADKEARGLYVYLTDNSNKRLRSAGAPCGIGPAFAFNQYVGEHVLEHLQDYEQRSGRVLTAQQLQRNTDGVLSVVCSKLDGESVTLKT